MGERPLKIGILAVQGAFREHVDVIRRTDVSASAEIIRGPTLPDDLDGIIIPGGESTTMILVAQRSGLLNELRSWVRSGRPTMGTCAGLILLATDVMGAELDEVAGERLEGLNCRVHRNYFGSQRDSFMASLRVKEGLPKDLNIKGAFIRAPLIESVDAEAPIKVLATIERDGKELIVAVQQNACLGVSFHPELTPSTAWHSYFLNLVRKAATSE